MRDPTTEAIVAGRGTFESAGGWGGDHHDGVPIFIYSRREPGIDISQWPLVTYVTDVETAMTQANQAAADKNVLVHGAAVAQLALAAGLLDEIELHVVTCITGCGAEVSVPPPSPFRRMEVSPARIRLYRLGRAARAMGGCDRTFAG